MIDIITLRKTYTAAHFLYARRDVPFTKFTVAQSQSITPREVEKQIEEMRCQGAPIIGGDKGLEWTTDYAKLKEYIEARWRRCSTIRRNTQKQAANAGAWFPEEPPIQLSLELEDE